MATIKIDRVSPQHTWSVYVNGELVEGGFFSYSAAQQCADDLRKAAQQEGLAR